MTEYELTITRRVPNPDYQSADAYREHRRYATDAPQFTEQRVLSVSVTEDEFAVMKRALLEHWAQSPAAGRVATADDGPTHPAPQVRSTAE